MQAIFLYMVLAGILFTGAQSVSLLEAHNKYRQIEGVPSMEKMDLLISDFILEHDNDMTRQLTQNAAKHARKCIFSHSANSDRQNIGSYSLVGENLFLGTGNPTSDFVVTNWYNEKKDYNRYTMSCTPRKQCGHYTQVIWSKSTALGCGTHRCASIEADGKIFKNALYVVCQYGPAGNYRGQSPFQRKSLGRGQGETMTLIRKIAEQLQSETPSRKEIKDEDREEDTVELMDELFSPLPPEEIPSHDPIMVL